MAELVTDPELLSELNAPEAKPKKAQPVTDPTMLAELNKGPSWGELLKDYGRQAVLKTAAGVVSPAYGLYRGVDWLGESLTGRDFLPDVETQQVYRELHEPAKTRSGKYVGAAAEGLGMMLPFAMGGLGLAARGADAFPRGTGWLARPYAINPARAAAIDLSSGAGGGLAQQAAEDAGAGPIGQTAAALAGGIASPLAMAAGMRYLPPALRDTGGALRLPGRGPPPPIGHNQGPPLEPLAPPGTPGGVGGPMGPPQPWSEVDRQSLQYATDALRAGGAKPEDIDKFMADLDWARRYHTSGLKGELLPEPGTPGGIGGPFGPPEKGAPRYIEPQYAPGTPGGPGDSPLGPGTPGTELKNYSEAQRVAGLAEMHPSLQELVGYEVRHNLEAANIAKPAFEARQHGFNTGAPVEPGLNIPTVGRYDRIVDTGEAGTPQPGMFRRIRDAMRRALRIQDDIHHEFGRTAAATDEAIMAKQTANADATFAKAREAGKDINLGEQPAVATALENLRRSAARPDLQAPVRNALEHMIALYAPSGNMVRNIVDFDRARRLASEAIGGFATGRSGGVLSGTIAGEMATHQKELVAAVRAIEHENLGALYGQGIDEFGADAQRLREIQLGRDIHKGKVSREAFDSIGEQARERALEAGATSRQAASAAQRAQNRTKLGYLASWSLENETKQGTDLTKQMRSDKHRQDLAYMIERSGMRSDQVTPQMTRDPATGEMVPTKAEYRDRPARFARQIGLEEAMIATREGAQGGSQTAGRQSTAEIFDALHEAKDILNSKSAYELAQRTGSFMVHKIFGMDAAVSANVVRMLLSNDPILQARAAAEIKFRLGSQTKVERFNEILKLSARSAAEQVRPGTVAPTTSAAAGRPPGERQR